MTPWGTVTLTASLGLGTLVVSVPYGFFSLYMLNDSATASENRTFALVVLAPTLAVGLLCGLACRRLSAVPACMLAAPAAPLLLGPIWVESVLPFNELGYSTPDTDLPNTLLALGLFLTGAAGLWGAHRILSRPARGEAAA